MAERAAACDEQTNLILYNLISQVIESGIVNQLPTNMTAIGRATAQVTLGERADTPYE
jgi:hypothetical protein